MTNQKNIVSEVTGLYDTTVFAEATPRSAHDVADALKRTNGDVSIGGGRFSMGGQVASPHSLHLDMRAMNRILKFSADEKIITVEAGITWHEIQRYIDPHDLSVAIMQTYGNFTVGGSLSVNAHGRYIGFGPLILSVLEICLVTANGEMILASPTKNAEVFYGAIGGYGGIGVIAHVTLKLADNCKVAKESEVMPLGEYLEFFKGSVRNHPKVIFHNADIYPPHYEKVRSVTWSETDKPLTNKKRVHGPRKFYPLERYLMWMVSEMPFGKWRREHILEPLFYKLPEVHLRNYEASYDVAELEPVHRKKKTYVLQEYFVPIDRINSFVQKAAGILNRNSVNAINISIRHAKQDPGSLMAWAQEEVFAFVLYYKQGTSKLDQRKVAVWTRELVQASIELGGSYYLPYQVHASQAQFEQAYPRHQEMFDLKESMDPEYRFKNVLWNTYYSKGNEHMTINDIKAEASDFCFIMNNKEWSDKMYRFLQVVFNTYNPDRFHQLMEGMCERFSNDAKIYETTQDLLPKIKVPLNDLRYGLPALFTQKKEMTRQTLELLGNRKDFTGYLEIGSKARYFSGLKKNLNLSGDLHFVEERAVTYSPVDMFERGAIQIRGKQHTLGHYEPLSGIDKGSIDLALCYIGLHHAHPDELDAFVASIVLAMREGGTFILRDHDVQTDEMNRFVSLIHSVFNMGLNETLAYDSNEPRFFNTLDHWVTVLKKHGLTLKAGPIYQAHDPSLNALMMFEKVTQA
jgi:FAD/FMN-containing dehydrogenase/SAM-dependent methyltransferase